MSHLHVQVLRVQKAVARPRTDHRESARIRDTLPIWARNSWLRGRCTRLARLEPATLAGATNTIGREHRDVSKNIVSDQETRAIPSYIEHAGSERLIGDERHPDSQNSPY